MGYSTPKKQLDLKEFLSEPAKKRPRKMTFGGRPRPQAAAPAAPAADVPAAPKAGDDD